MVKLTAPDIRRLFELLDCELGNVEAEGELCLVGGAVISLALNARDATRDVDVLFKPTKIIRQAAARVAAEADAPEDWLDDAVKGYLSTRGDFDPFLELPHLRVFVPPPPYLLAMKCAAVPLGEEFHDVDDVRYLLRYLNISSVSEAIDVVAQYFDESQMLPKAKRALEEILGRD